VLLGMNASPDVKDQRGMIPLQVCVESGFYEGFQTLVKRCPNPLTLIDRKGNTLLHLSIIHCSSVRITYDILGQTRTDVRVTNDAGQNAMDLVQAARDALGHHKAQPNENDPYDPYKEASAPPKTGRLKTPEAKGPPSEGGTREGNIDVIDEMVQEELIKLKKKLRKLGLNTVARRPYRPPKEKAHLYKAPKKLKQEEDLRMTAEWLADQGLSKDCEIYADILRRKGVGYDQLYTLTDESLREKGISKIGVRNKIMHGVSEILPQGSKPA